MTHPVSLGSGTEVSKDLISSDIRYFKLTLIASDFGALWVIRKNQGAIPEGFRVAFDLEIGNKNHNFEPVGEIKKS